MKMTQYRLRAGYRLTDVAKLLHTTETTVYRWEHGIHEPKPSVLKQLAQLYQCTMEELLDDRV